MRSKNISIYIHIPFCESRCYYCDFYSSVINKEVVRKYFERLNKEIELYREFLRDKEIKSIFIGGGTPSAVPAEYIAGILEKLSFSKEAEVTIEVNPNSLTEEKLKVYINAGINRFSMGAQSFNDKILKAIGRVHKKDDILKAIELFKKYNVRNFSFDLMMALPYQKFSDIEYSMEMVRKLDPTHISYYSLIIEEGTKMSKLYENRDDIFPDEVLDRKMYHYIVKSLEDMGYHQYEISNFAKTGYESVHNKKYWELENYIGLGCSAHSNIDNIRYFNYSDFNEYFRRLDKFELPIEYKENLTKKDRINEYMIMGFRMNKGISIDEINNRFDINVLEYYNKEIEKNSNYKNIEIENGCIRLTDRGRDISNIVEIDFLKV